MGTTPMGNYSPLGNYRPLGPLDHESNVTQCSRCNIHSRRLIRVRVPLVDRDERHLCPSCVEAFRRWWYQL